MYQKNPLLESIGQNIGYGVAGAVPGFIVGSVGGGTVGEKIRNYLDNKDINNYKKQLQNREFFKHEADQAINALKERIQYYKQYGTGTYEIGRREMIARDKGMIQEVIRMYQTNDTDGFYKSYGKYGEYTDSGKKLNQSYLKHLTLGNRIGLGSTIAGTAAGALLAPKIAKVLK